MKKLLLCCILVIANMGFAGELSSWKKSNSLDSIETFVKQVTSRGKNYVKPADRIAVFDNDGTLWTEQPAYFQLFFAIDRVKLMAKKDAELARKWKREEPFKSALAGDIKKVLSNRENIFKLIGVTHAGMTQEEFRQVVLEWIKTAKHPTTGKKYTEMVYQPMLEILDYLRANGFKTYIVSGGGIDFMRPWVEGVYGIPPEQVIGSRVKKQFAMIDDVPVIKRLPEMDFVDDKEGKPVGIDLQIGKRPIAAFGNSDGDLAMLQYTAGGPGKRLMVYVHHTDAKREWAYDRKSHIGQLDKGLDEAKKNGWTVVDMKEDWKLVYPQ